MTGTTTRLTATDLTRADVEALADFLHTRVHSVLAEHHVESDVWKAVLALRLVLEREAKATREAFRRTDRCPETEQDRFRRWNRLATLALGWKDDEGFDERWKPVAHPTAEAAAVSAVLR